MKQSKAVPKDKKGLTIWIIAVVVSALIIVVWHAAVSKGLHIMDQKELTARAKVTKLSFVTEENNEELQYYSKVQYFYAKVLSGQHRGQTVQAYQEMNSYIDSGERFVEEGDRVILVNFESVSGVEEWAFSSYARFDYVLVLGIAFLALIILFGRGKGVSTVISLAFTCLAVFCVFLPAVLSGKNIYLMTILICIYTIVMTLVITNGISSKSVTTMLGCGAGVLAAAVLTVIFDRIMHLTGIIDEHSVYLQAMGAEGVEINLRALIFAMITIGAMGAVMDVAMDIASSLNEIHRHRPDISFKELFGSGMNIGRDVMGTMANTLVLAYIGSSLCTILLRVSYANSLMELLNTESIAVELLQAIVGSLGILLTIPLTALVCCIMYTAGKRAGSNE